MSVAKAMQNKIKHILYLFTIWLPVFKWLLSPINSVYTFKNTNLKKC